MAAFFIDYDGTLVRFGTHELLPGVLETVHAWLRDGHQLYITTQRPDGKDVLRNLRNNGIVPNAILTNVTSPRVIINDQGAISINRRTDSPWMAGEF